MRPREKRATYFQPRLDPLRTLSPISARYTGKRRSIWPMEKVMIAKIRWNRHIPTFQRRSLVVGTGSLTAPVPPSLAKAPPRPSASLVLLEPNILGLGRGAHQHAAEREGPPPGGWQVLLAAPDPHAQLLEAQRHVRGLARVPLDPPPSSCPPPSAAEHRLHSKSGE